MTSLASSINPSRTGAGRKKNTIGRPSASSRQSSAIELTNKPVARIASWLTLASLATLLAYLPSLNGPFVFDDLSIVESTSIREFPPTLHWWNPVSRWFTSLTFACNYQLSGLHTFSYRFTNLCLHIFSGWLVAYLVILILRLCNKNAKHSKTQHNDRIEPEEEAISSRDIDCERQTRERLEQEPITASQRIVKATNQVAHSTHLFTPYSSAAFLATAWLLHPLSSSAVAYVVQRSEILAGLAITLFLIAIIRDAFSKHYRWQWLAALTLIIGMCCKTNAVSALPIAILMDRLLLSNSWSALIKRRGALYLLPVLMGILSIWVLLPGLRRGDAGVGFSDEIPSVPIYLATQCQVFWHYIWLCVWPSKLSIDYRWPPVRSVWVAIPWIIPTLILLGFAIVRYRLRKMDGWLILSLFLLLAPTSTLIPITDIAVDHRMYLGSVSVIAVGMIGVKQLFYYHPRYIPKSSIACVSILFAILGCLFLRTYIRSHDWSSAFNLWLSAAKITPSSPRALQNLTNASKEEGRKNELVSALIELRQQVLDNNQPAPAVASRLGEELFKAGDPTHPEPLLREAVAGLDPHGTLDERQEHAAARINLALLHLQRKQFDEAETQLRAAIASDPKAAYGHAMLGDLLMRQTRYAEAVERFRSALAIQPDWLQVKNDLSKAIEALETP
jgi:protein O-mannosyl-transferase